MIHTKAPFTLAILSLSSGHETHAHKASIVFLL
jgi:hypothetical protein